MKTLSPRETATRLHALLPNGIPRYVRCYDNGGATADRYAVVFTGKYPKTDGFVVTVFMSAEPSHPQGVFHHSEEPSPDTDRYGYPPALGRRCLLGRRIPFLALPAECQRVVLDDYKTLWSLPHD